MKDAIGGTWLYIVVIAFIALFTTYVSVTTTYSRCFRIKDDIVTVIEHYHGYNDNAEKEIQNLLNGMGYSNEGKCPDDTDIKYTAYSLSGHRGYGTKTNYCIAKNVVSTKPEEYGKTGASVGMFESAYYQVVVFFKLEWPIFRNIFSVTISGETQVITNPEDTTEIENNANYL